MQWKVWQIWLIKECLEFSQEMGKLPSSVLYRDEIVRDIKASGARNPAQLRKHYINSVPPYVPGEIGDLVRRNLDKLDIVYEHHESVDST